MIQRMNERDRLLQAYTEAEGEERAKLLAKLVVIDEGDGEDESWQSLYRNRRY